LPPEPDALHAHEDDRDDRDSQPDDEGVQDHFAAIVPAATLGSSLVVMGSEMGRFMPS
jgi:hypothetical protein